MATNKMRKKIDVDSLITIKDYIEKYHYGLKRKVFCGYLLTTKGGNVNNPLLCYYENNGCRIEDRKNGARIVKVDSVPKILATKTMKKR